MSNSLEEFLSIFGWDDNFRSQISGKCLEDYRPAKVIGEVKNLHRLQVSTNSTIWACLSGKLLFSAHSRDDLPVVGDWVMIEFIDNSDKAVIRKVCPRESAIKRKDVGSSIESQILSTNFDYVFVATPANLELKFRRLDRYLEPSRKGLGFKN